MTLPEKAIRLKIFTGEENKNQAPPSLRSNSRRSPKARYCGRIGVPRGDGLRCQQSGSHNFHTQTSEDLPLIIEIIDRPKN